MLGFNLILNGNQLAAYSLDISRSGHTNQWPLKCT